MGRTMGTETFDAAARAVVDGDLETLRGLLAADAGLARARSNDAFRATLLHFVAANGVPDELQRTPPNAVEVCRALLAAGAEPDAVGAAYGGGSNRTPLALLVSSWHPFERGVQAELVHALAAGGARVDGLEDDGAPLATALVFGYTAAAEALVAAGARVDNLFFAAALGQLDRVRAFFDESGALRPGALGTYAPQIAKELGADPRAHVQEAFHFAATHGRREVGELLLALGADVNGRTTGHHAELPLLQAALVHEVEAARWLLARGADPDLVCAKRGASTREHVRRNGPNSIAALL